jgi:hypothetical protein
LQHRCAFVDPVGKGSALREPQISLARYYPRSLRFTREER